MNPEKKSKDTSSSSENDDVVRGLDLIGREILMCWEDGIWYDAVVVRYYQNVDEYKVVYISDDAIEITSLSTEKFIVKPKQRRGPTNPVLVGSIIEFTYPSDKKRYKAMVYSHSYTGDRIKIAYINEHNTDNLRGGGWDFLKASPCVDDSVSEDESEDEDLWKNYFQKSRKGSGIVKQRRTVQRRKSMAR